MDNFLKRVNSKMEARGHSGRQDLELHDAKAMDKDAVRVLATYSNVYGPPSVFDIQNWLKQRLGEFADKVSAKAETISVYPEKNFVTFIVESKKIRQPLTASAGMIKAGVDQYLDGEQNLWEVVKADQGPSYIVKHEGTPVERMLDMRRQALRGGASGRKHVTLAAVDSSPSMAGGFATADVGDTVDFYAAGMIHRGKVSSAGSAGVKISTGSDTFTVDPQAITYIVEKGPGAAKEQDERVASYYSRLYPGNPEMVNIIAPTSGFKKDPNLKVDPIEKASGFSASVSASMKPAKEAAPRPTVRATPRKG